MNAIELVTNMRMRIWPELNIPDNEFEENLIRDPQIRFHAQFLDGGESSDKFFAAVEQIQGARNHISALTRDGSRNYSGYYRWPHQHVHKNSLYSELNLEQPADEEACHLIRPSPFPSRQCIV